MAGEEISDSAVTAARELRTVFSRLRRTMREVAESGELSGSQTAVLTRLYKEGASTASGLAAGERVRPQSRANPLSVLADAGLITRQRAREDGRRQVIELTAAGRRHAEGDRRARREWLARMMEEKYTEAQRRKIMAALALLDTLSES